MLCLPTSISFVRDSSVGWCIYDYPAWIRCDCENSPDCLLSPEFSFIFSD